MSENGRIVIPVEIRKQLGLRAGEPLTLVVEGDAMRLMTRRARIRAAQASLARHLTPGQRIDDELIEERREEARRELLEE